jgi:hypothetical protein
MILVALRLQLVRNVVKAWQDASPMRWDQPTSLRSPAVLGLSLKQQRLDVF